MKTPNIIITLIVIVATIIFNSCSVSKHSIKYPNYHIEFYNDDFDYSEQVTAEATSVRIFEIDWKRLFKWESGLIESDKNSRQSQKSNIAGSISSVPLLGISVPIIPVLGNYGKGKVSSYALYRLMKENPGYDVIIYPRYETQKFVVPGFFSKRTVKVTARLGKLK